MTLDTFTAMQAGYSNNKASGAHEEQGLELSKPAWREAARLHRGSHMVALHCQPRAVLAGTVGSVLQALLLMLLSLTVVLLRLCSLNEHTQLRANNR